MTRCLLWMICFPESRLFPNGVTPFRYHHEDFFLPSAPGRAGLPRRPSRDPPGKPMIQLGLKRLGQDSPLPPEVCTSQPYKSNSKSARRPIANPPISVYFRFKSRFTDPLVLVLGNQSIARLNLVEEILCRESRWRRRWEETRWQILSARRHRSKLAKRVSIDSDELWKTTGDENAAERRIDHVLIQ